MKNVELEIQNIILILANAKNNYFRQLAMGLKVFNLYLFVSKKQTTCPRDIYVFISSADKDPNLVLLEHPYLRRLSKKMSIIACDDHPTHHNLSIGENGSQLLPVNFQEIINTQENFFYIGMVNNGLDGCGEELKLKLLCSPPCNTCAKIDGHFCQSQLTLGNMYV